MMTGLQNKNRSGCRQTGDCHDRGYPPNYSVSFVGYPLSCIRRIWGNYMTNRMVKLRVQSYKFWGFGVRFS